MNRYTFVLQVHPDGPSTLENLSTHERIRVADLSTVGPQIERWLAELPSASTRSASASGADGPSPDAPPG
jgi:hypothetical protein